MITLTGRAAGIVIGNSTRASRQHRFPHRWLSSVTDFIALQIVTDTDNNTMPSGASSAGVASSSQRAYHSGGIPASRNGGSSSSRRRGTGSPSSHSQHGSAHSRRSPPRARLPRSPATPVTELVSDDVSPGGGSSSTGNSRTRCVRHWV